MSGVAKSGWGRKICSSDFYVHFLNAVAVAIALIVWIVLSIVLNLVPASFEEYVSSITNVELGITLILIILSGVFHEMLHAIGFRLGGVTWKERKWKMSNKKKESDDEESDDEYKETKRYVESAHNKKWAGMMVFRNKALTKEWISLRGFKLAVVLPIVIPVLYLLVYITVFNWIPLGVLSVVAAGLGGADYALMKRLRGLSWEREARSLGPHKSSRCVMVR